MDDQDMTDVATTTEPTNDAAAVAAAVMDDRYRNLFRI